MQDHKTGGGVGTNQYQVRGQAVQQNHALTPTLKVPTPQAVAAPLPWRDTAVIAAARRLDIDLFQFATSKYGTQIEKIDDALDDPTCPEGLLRALAMVSEEAYGRGGAVHIAKHSACPPDLLYDIGTSPSNSRHELDTIVQNPNCSASLWSAWAKAIYPNARLAAAQSPYCPPEIVRRLADDLVPDVRQAAVSNPNYPPELIESNADNPLFRAALAANPNSPPELLEQFAGDGKSQLLLAVNPGSPPQLLIKLGHVHGLQKTLLQNPNTPAQALINIIQNKYFDPKSIDAVLKHTNADSTCLDAAAHHRSAVVRRAAANHPNTASATLDHLSKSADSRIRIRVASHHNLPESAVARLAADTNAIIRRQLWNNPNLPDHIKTIITLGGSRP